MRKEFYKLVRDNVPYIIRDTGDLPKIAIMSDSDFQNELALKLQEECAELVSTYNVNEFADVLEVLEAIAKTHGIEWSDILKEKEQKAKNKGTFKEKIFLLYTE